MLVKVADCCCNKYVWWVAMACRFNRQVKFPLSDQRPNRIWRGDQDHTGGEWGHFCGEAGCSETAPVPSPSFRDLSREIWCLQTKLSESEKSRRAAEAEVCDLRQAISTLAGRMSVAMDDLREKDDIMEAMLEKITMLMDEATKSHAVQKWHSDVLKPFSLICIDSKLHLSW